MTAAQERYYRAPPILLMWWRFRRHRVAVASGAVLLALYVMILFCEFLAPYGLDSRHVDHIYAPPQPVHIFHDGGLVWPYVYGYDYRLDMTNLRRVYTPDTEKRAADTVFLPRRQLRVLGPRQRRPAPGLPAGGRRNVPARQRPARPRSAVAHHLRRADFADGRADRRRDQLYPRHRDRRHRRILRRLDRHADPARDRGHPVVSASAAVDGAVGDPAGDLEPAARLFRHHDHPRHDRVDASGARGALEAVVAARGGFLHRRGADGRETGADYRPPSAAELYEPPDRVGHADHSRA